MVRAPVRRRTPGAGAVGPRAGLPLGLALWLTALSGGCDHARHGAPSPEASTASNPVQQEMQLLTTALEGAVRGIGMGDVRSLEHDLHRVHAAREATAAALHDGTYRPPRNPDRLAAFEALDEAFHADLERLAEASQRNDVGGAATALGSVLQACQGCHSEFRP